MAIYLKNFSDLDRSVRVGGDASVRQGSAYRAYGKRIFDIAAVLLLAPIAIPLILIVAFLAGRDGASAFYRQKRIGMGGQVFSLLKIRTMVPDADARLAAYLASDPAAKAEWDSTQKLKNDPRITRIGRFLRKSSLDELPQFWNVLRGDMSLIGPRPMMVDQKQLYPGTAYYKLRPGITGSWQVSDRNESTFAGRAEFDTSYYNALSLRTDLSIVVRTFGVVMRCTGY